ncbi:MAG: hypothetical protein AB2L14_26965 [Candidatus Xenobiia bacterium LiM19]
MKRRISLLFLFFFCLTMAPAVLRGSESLSLKGFSGTIVKLDISSRLLTVKTFEKKTIQVFIPQDIPIVKSMIRMKMEDFAAGEEVFITAGRSSEEPVTARNLFSLESALLMAAGNVSLYEYTGIVSRIDRKASTVELKTSTGASREMLITDYTKLEKNFRKAALPDFKTGDTVFCEVRFKGLPTQTTMAVSALSLYDTLSYVCNKMAVTLGSEMARGTVHELNTQKKTLVVGKTALQYGNDTLWVMDRTRGKKKDVKGKTVIILALPSSSMARAIIDPASKEEVLSAMTIYREIFRRGALSPIAEGKVTRLEVEKNLIVVQNRWGRSQVLRTSPGNTSFFSENDSHSSLSDIQKGESLYIEGYPPDQATKVIKLP